MTQIPRPTIPTPKEHRYTSTYCFHDDHTNCKRECKTCRSRCRCRCHVFVQGLEPAPERPAAAELGLPKEQPTQTATRPTDEQLEAWASATTFGPMLRAVAAELLQLRAQRPAAAQKCYMVAHKHLDGWFIPGYGEALDRSAAMGWLQELAPENPEYEYRLLTLTDITEESPIAEEAHRCADADVTEEDHGVIAPTLAEADDEETAMADHSDLVVSESGTVYAAQQWPPNHNTRHIGTAVYDAIAAAVRMPLPEDGEPTPAEQEDTTVRCDRCDALGTYCGHALPEDGSR